MHVAGIHPELDPIAGADTAARADPRRSQGLAFAKRHRRFVFFPLRALKFPAGSMGPKVEAACRFVEATGKPAMIGRLDDAADLVRGTRGTVVESVSQPAPSRGAA